MTPFGAYIAAKLVNMVYLCKFFCKILLFVCSFGVIRNELPSLGLSLA